MENAPKRRWYETRAAYARRLAAWQAMQPASQVGLVGPRGPMGGLRNLAPGYRSPSELRYQPEAVPAARRSDDDGSDSFTTAMFESAIVSEATDSIIDSVSSFDSSASDTSSSSDSFSGGGGDFGGGGSDGSW